MPYCDGIALHPPNSRAHPVSTSRSVLKRGTIPPVGMQPAATETSSNHAAARRPNRPRHRPRRQPTRTLQKRALPAVSAQVLASAGCNHTDSRSSRPQVAVTKTPQKRRAEPRALRVSLCSALIDRTSARSRSGPGSSSPRVETRVVQTGPLVTQGRGRSVRAGSTPPLTRLRAGFEQPRETNRRSRLRFTTGQARRCLAPAAT